MVPLDYIPAMLAQLAAAAPALALWIGIIIFAAMRLQRSGGRAERFLLTGGIVKLPVTLLNVPMVFLPHWVSGMTEDMAQASSVLTSCHISLEVIGAAGIICIIYAFWVKFKERNNGAAAQPVP